MCVNKKARFHYHIIDRFEAGLVLSGPEIKSIRAGEVSLDQSYVAPYNGELYLVGAHIRPYKFNADPEYDPLRRRKLLMHKHEIHKLIGRVEQKGLTIVPLQLHLKRGFAKLEIALARGKDAPDKRETIREREAQREMSRVVRGKR